ncbi:hypothetical protein IP88_16450 [alpha proteobacterium AAP81b]|nr:hypothetical protein IP88_16450 [alpha proteobacterium AAP81b]
MTLRPGLLLAAGLSAVLAVAATAQPADHIKARHELMEQNGKDTKAGFAMVQGKTPFDAAAALAILTRMNGVANNFGKHFPKGTETGGGTEAAPAIWEKPAEFQAALAKFQKDTAAAVAAKPADAAALGQVLGTVAANCKSCHESFRVKKG